MLKILNEKEAILHKALNECPFPYLEEDINLAKEMHHYLVLSQDPQYSKKHNIRSGVGLAANQVGFDKRILAIELDDPEDDKHYQYALINPKVISKSTKLCYIDGGEGCLSVDRQTEGLVPRSYKVMIKAFDCLTMEEITINAKGYLAIALQHELDHLNGIIFTERIDEEFTKNHENAVKI